VDEAEKDEMAAVDVVDLPVAEAAAVDLPVAENNSSAATAATDVVVLPFAENNSSIAATDVVADLPIAEVAGIDLPVTEHDTTVHKHDNKGDGSPGHPLLCDGEFILPEESPRMSSPVATSSTDLESFAAAPDAIAISALPDAHLLLMDGVDGVDGVFTMPDEHALSDSAVWTTSPADERQNAVPDEDTAVPVAGERDSDAGLRPASAVLVVTEAPGDFLSEPAADVTPTATTAPTPTQVDLVLVEPSQPVVDPLLHPQPQPLPHKRVSIAAPAAKPVDDRPFVFPIRDLKQSKLQRAVEFSLADSSWGRTFHHGHPQHSRRVYAEQFVAEGKLLFRTKIPQPLISIFF
jgi:hypothetical protein